MTVYSDFDITPPVVTSVQVLTPNMDVTNSSQNFTLQVAVTDSQSGVAPIKTYTWWQLITNNSIAISTPILTAT
jgi:hypothetical protein